MSPLQGDGRCSRTFLCLSSEDSPPGSPRLQWGRRGGRVTDTSSSFLGLVGFGGGEVS